MVFHQPRYQERRTPSYHKDRSSVTSQRGGVDGRERVKVKGEGRRGRDEKEGEKGGVRRETEGGRGEGEG